MFLRSDTADGGDGPEEDEGGGGGGSDRISGAPKTSPSGGIPLPDAEPAPVRLRGHEKLADLRPRPERRRVTEPARTPRRVPERSPLRATGTGCVPLKKRCTSAQAGLRDIVVVGQQALLVHRRLPGAGCRPPSRA